MIKKVEVLISAMHQSNLSIVDNTNIHTDVLIINQCDKEQEFTEKRDFGTVRCISTIERGLSRSRNKAMENSKGDYCLFCDDDELLYSDYPEKILQAFNQFDDADIICFKVKRENKVYSDKAMKIGYLKSLKISSWQIVIKSDSLYRAGIKFDTNFGSGTLLGSGEENIFMYDCLKSGLRIYSVPFCIGEVAQKESQWFKGFNEQYFLNRGVIIRRLLGRLFGYGYCLYFSLSKYSKYKKAISLFRVQKLLLKGMKIKSV
jgi:glycosyltransferase involved in cell wall biosynthesis